MRTFLQHVLPHKIISKIADLSANCEITWIKNFLIGYFLKRYNVNMREAIVEDPFAYKSYNAFLTKHLKPTARPIAGNAQAIVSPADGLMAQCGHIKDDKIIQAKGHDYTVQDLLANDPIAKQFMHGNFATIYLAPKDYHRVHMPFAGTLQKMIYIPGKLFSVNTHAAENIPGVFARNERVVSIFQTEAGVMAVVLVGAMIVGGMETTWAGQIAPPHSKQVQTTDYSSQPPITLAKGAEMGLFKLGSTVIVLFAPNAVNWDQSITIDSAVKFGQQIGLLRSVTKEQV